jgi:hypothetical protein
MGFLSPWMLLGGLAVGIPIAIHFFFRSRYRTVPWAAMKFLLAAIEQTSTRLKFQELLLLALRCLLLLVLALAMARPISTLSRGTGGGDAIDAVLVFDTSYSMTAQDGSQSRLARAQKTALDIIDKLPPHSGVQIIAGSSKAELLGPLAPGNIDQAKQIVRDLKVQHLPTDYSASIQLAKSVLEKASASNKALFFFSDLQKSGFEQQESRLRSDLMEMHEKAEVTFVRLAANLVKNVAIESITPQTGVPRPKERTSFAIVVRNTAPEGAAELKVENATIRLFVDADPAETEEAVESKKDATDQKGETQEIPPLAPGQKHVLTMSATFDKPGLHVVSAVLKGDDLDGDNRFDYVVNVREQVRVLVVDGDFHYSVSGNPSKSSSYYLLHALQPVRDVQREAYFLQPQTTSAELASPAMLKQADICILVNVRIPEEARPGRALAQVPMDFLEDLAKFVREGHGLIVIPGQHVNIKGYNEILGKKLGLLPMPFVTLHEQESKKNLNFSRGSFSLPAYRFIREDKDYEIFNYLATWKWFEVKEPKPAPVETKDKELEAKPPAHESTSEVVLRFDNGAPVVVSKRVGEGEVIMLTTSVHPDPKPGAPDLVWNHWALPPFSRAFVPFWDVMINHLLKGRDQIYNVTAGESLVWLPREKEQHNYTLRTSDKDKIRLGVPLPRDRNKRDSRAVVRTPELNRAGIYRMVAWTGQQGEPAGDWSKLGMPVAVVPDARETLGLELLTNKQLESLVGFTPRVLDVSKPGPASLETHFDTKEWTMWVLLVLLVLLIVESLFAWYCGRAK